MMRKLIYFLSLLLIFSHASLAFSQTNPVPVIQSDVDLLDFGDQVAGQLGDPQTITITNIGEVDLDLQDNKFIGEDPADFVLSMDFCSFQTLAPGETCQIQVSMRATTTGDRTGQFAIESDDPDLPILLINLQGKGTGSGGCHLNPVTTKFPSGEGWEVWAVSMMLLLGLLKRLSKN